MSYRDRRLESSMTGPGTVGLFEGGTEVGCGRRAWCGVVWCGGSGTDAYGLWEVCFWVVGEVV